MVACASRGGAANRRAVSADVAAARAAARSGGGASLCASASAAKPACGSNVFPDSKEVETSIPLARAGETERSFLTASTAASVAVGRGVGTEGDGDRVSRARVEDSCLASVRVAVESLAGGKTRKATSPNTASRAVAKAILGHSFRQPDVQAVSPLAGWRCWRATSPCNRWRVAGCSSNGCPACSRRVFAKARSSFSMWRSGDMVRPLKVRRKG